MQSVLSTLFFFSSFISISFQGGSGAFYALPAISTADHTRYGYSSCHTCRADESTDIIDTARSKSKFLTNIPANYYTHHAFSWMHCANSPLSEFHGAQALRILLNLISTTNCRHFVIDSKIIIYFSVSSFPNAQTYTKLPFSRRTHRLFCFDLLFLL